MSEDQPRSSGDQNLLLENSKDCNCIYANLFKNFDLSVNSNIMNRKIRCACCGSNYLIEPVYNQPYLTIGPSLNTTKTKENRKKIEESFDLFKTKMNEDFAKLEEKNDSLKKENKDMQISLKKSSKDIKILSELVSHLTEISEDSEENYRKLKDKVQDLKKTLNDYRLPYDE